MIYNHLYLHGSIVQTRTRHPGRCKKLRNFRARMRNAGFRHRRCYHRFSHPLLVDIASLNRGPNVQNTDCSAHSNNVLYPMLALLQVRRESLQRGHESDRNTNLPEECDSPIQPFGRKKFLQCLILHTVVNKRYNNPSNTRMHFKHGKASFSTIRTSMLPAPFCKVSTAPSEDSRSRATFAARVVSCPEQE